MPEKFRLVITWIALFNLLGQPLFACTGLTLRAKDGAVLFGRTQEWGTFDLRSRVVVIPRAINLQSPTPDGTNGLAWKTKYGAVGIDAVVTTIHDAPLGVVTNGPNYDWHLANLLNFTNLDTPLPKRKVEDLKSLKFVGGNRLFGLPGDLSSPSRFLRAAAYSGTARDTADGKETICEMFRILDNFNLSVGASAEGSGEANPEGMRSSTIWTTVYDTKNLVLYYHTMNNRRVRQIDLNKLDFNAANIVRIPVDREKSQDTDDVTPLR